MNENESNALSAARAIAIGLVVLGHAMTGDIRKLEPRIDFIWNIIYSFHMFFFFFVSGILFEKNINKYKKNKGNFVIGKFKLLIVPYMAITIIEYISLLAINHMMLLMGKGELIGSISIKGFFDAIILNKDHFDTHLWYIYLLFFIFAINIVLFKKRVLFIVVLGAIVLILGYPFLSYIPWKFQSIVYYIVPFILGRLSYDMHFLRFCIDQRRIKIYMYGVYMILINGLIFYLEKIYLGDLFGIPGIRIGMVQNIKYITGLIGCVLLVYVGHKLTQIAIARKIVKTLDKYSYEIYLYHQPFITVGCATVLLKFKSPILVNFVLSTCVGIIIPIFVSKFFLRKNALLRKVFMGDH